MGLTIAVRYGMLNMPGGIPPFQIAAAVFGTAVMATLSEPAAHEISEFPMTDSPWPSRKVSENTYSTIPYPDGPEGSVLAGQVPVVSIPSRGLLKA